MALCALGVRAARAQNAPPATAILAGVIRDSTAAPIADAEIIVRDIGRTGRTDARGAFELREVPAGAHEVWFRRLGYTTIEYNWRARAGERTEIAVTLHAIPRMLDPVVVRAQEDRRMRGTSSILGLVVDTSGTPVEEAEVQLVGADRIGVTRANGGFLFRPLTSGTYLIKVRKLGYAPEVMTVDLRDRDEREVAIRIRLLPVQLDAMVVAERSGYGRDQRAYEELDERMRWHNFRSVVLGRDDLARFYGASLDYAIVSMGVPGLEQMGNWRRSIPRSIDPRGTRQSMGGVGTGVDDVCILLNGKREIHQPLSAFTTSQLELLEIYPSGTEVTGTISDRMSSPKCKAQSLFQHPTYYVVWER